MSDAAPNVLFIIADDLNAWIGALGRHPDVRTPSIDALANRGSLFTRAYCAAPYCNASRMNLFTGHLPSTTGIYGNEPFWDRPDRPATLFETFRQAGYYTHGAGKVFHGVFDYAHAARTATPEARWVEMQNRPSQWHAYGETGSEPLPIHRPLNRLFDFADFESVPPWYHHFDWGPLPAEAEASMPDERTCRSVSDFLANPPEQPFLCAAGLYKPHLPWHAPSRFFDLYDANQISLPHVRDDDLDDVPPLAREWALSPPDHDLVTRRDQWRPAVQGYLACISYCDWLVGRMMAALDASPAAENTWVVFCGDNGFHLGEKLHWRKFTLWEEATRVPLIIVPPKNAPNVQPRIHDPVGLTDVAATLFDVCGIAGAPQTDGASLAAAMRGAAVDRPTISTWGRGNHSVRSGNWRFTRYGAGGDELYDLSADPNEWTNLANDPRLASRAADLARLLPAD